MSAIEQVIVVQIENTAYCNRKCPWCPQSVMNFTEDMVMEWDTFTKIISELALVGYRNRIHPYGNGEPLTDPCFIEKVKYIKENLPECFIFIATNGDMVGKTYDFNEMWSAGVNNIQCNHYDDTNRHLMKLQNENFIKVNGKFYQVGVDHHKLGDLRTTFYNRAGNVKITNITPAPTCWFPGRKLYFNYLGDMLICCADWNYKDKIGNINENNLTELLESSKLKQYKEKLAQRRADELPLCSQCNLIRH